MSNKDGKKKEEVKQDWAVDYFMICRRIQKLKDRIRVLYSENVHLGEDIGGLINIAKEASKEEYSSLSPFTEFWEEENCQTPYEVIFEAYTLFEKRKELQRHKGRIRTRIYQLGKVLFNQNKILR